MYLEKQIKKCLENPQYAFGILGEKGFGKSSIVKEIAKNLDYKIIDIRLASSDETDLGGLPRIINNEYYDYMPPAWLYNLCNDKENKYLILLDEINQSMPEVLNAIFPLILASVNNDEVERHLAGLKLPQNTAICLLGNTEEDNPYITEIPPALLDRVFWIPFKKNISLYKPYLVKKHGKIAEDFFKEFGKNNVLNPRQIDRFLWVCKNQLIDSNSLGFISKNFKDSSFEGIEDLMRDLNNFYKNCNFLTEKGKTIDLDPNDENDIDFLENI